MEITIFKDIKQTSQPFYKHVNVILDRIKDGASKDTVKSIRGEKDKENRRVLKAKLPAICFSGTFSKRADNAIINHSGLICLDFDEYKTKTLMLTHVTFHPVLLAANRTIVIDYTVTIQIS